MKKHPDMIGHNRICHFVLLFCLLLTISQTLFSQTENTRFRTLSPYDNDELSNNLPHSEIRSTTMDSQGYLWVCSEGGLSKYNSHRIHNFKHDSSDSTSLPNNLVNKFLEDSKGNCYVGTNIGFSILNRNTNTFESFYYDADDPTSISHSHVIDMIEGENKQIYIATKGGVNIFNPDKKEFETIEDTIQAYCFLKDNDEKIWMGTHRGISKIEGKNKGISHFPLLDKNQHSLNVFDIHQDDSGQLWLATEGGLYTFDINSLLFEKVDLEGDLKEISCTSLAELPKGKLYVGTMKNAMFRLDMLSQEVEHHFKFIDGNKFRISSNNISHLMVDKWDVLWICSSGLQSINPVHSKFKMFYNDNNIISSKNGVRYLFASKKGEIWMSTGKGIIKKKTLASFPEDILLPPPLKQGSFVHVTAFWEDEEGLVWCVIRNGGVYKQIKNENRFILVESNLDFKNSVLYEATNDTTLLHNNIWTGTSAGICRFNVLNKTKEWILPKDHLSTALDNEIRHIEMDSDKNLWFMNSNNLCFYDVEKRKMETFLPNPQDSTYNLLSTSIGNIVTTKDRIYLSGKVSLSFLDRKTKRFTNITYGDGYKDREGTFAGLEIANDGTVWFSGGGNVGRFDPETDKMQRYLTFIYTSGNSVSSVCKTQEGNILFGCRLGIQQIEPNNLPKKDTIRPKVVLSQFQLFNLNNSFGKAYEKLDRVDLEYYEKFFSIEFTGLKYFHEAEYWYEAKLEGYDDEWKYLRTEKVVEYKDIPPGKYIFLVKAKNMDGVESLPFRLPITIRPPFWKTIPFYLLIATVIGIILYLLLLNYQKNKLLKKEKEAAEQHALYKSRFLANMSHEIRTPMNAIMGLNKLMMGTPLNKTQQKYTEVINLSCENLIWIINDILDQSKIESGKLSIQSQAFNFTNLIEQLDLLLDHKFNDKKLKFTIDIDEDIPKILVGDPTRLFQILTNLIVNAIKFTEEGYIYLSISAKEKEKENITLYFEVIDTGIGIPEEKLTTVFQSFEQVERHKNQQDYENRGTGLGLSICKDLLELQGGNIGVKSQLGKGSTFYFHLPFKIGNEAQINRFKKIEDFELPSALSVLLVEDVPFNQFLVQENFKKHLPESVIDVAENGEIALTKIKNKSYDIILMDVKMPVMDGLEATKNIRLMEDMYFRKIPILGLTASVIPDQIKKCIEIGMNDCVTKPLDFQKLQEKMAILLNK